jgi:hypothetical protein
MGEAARVLDIYWDRFLAVEPLFATLVGDARFDDALPDQAEDGRAERHRVLGCLEHGMDRLWAVGHMPIGFRFGRGCCWAWSRSGSPAAPPRSGRPTCGGWRGVPAAHLRTRTGTGSGERTLGAGAGPRWDREQAVPGASLERPCTPVERPIGNSRSHRSQGHEQEDP